MVEVLNGKNVILFFREFAKRETESAAKLRFQTEHSISKSKENESTTTKDGVINSISDGENTADITSLAYSDDTQTLTTWQRLEDMFDKNALVEMWQVDITGVTSDNLTVKPTYFQGYFTDFELSAPADGQVELSYTFAINGNGVSGDDVLTSDQLNSVQATVYEYQKMAKTSE